MDKLAKDRPDLAGQVQSGEITATAANRLMKKDAVSENVEALPEGKYRVIYADPPWSYNDTRDGESATGAEDHYPSMKVAEICALGIPELAHADAVLFLWTTSPLLPDGLKVASAWGFAYKACFVWDKIKHNMGHYNSVRHEFLLVCTRGSCTPDVSKLFDSVQSIERTGKHSEKPEEFRSIIDTIYPHGGRIELFRRGEAPEGWKVWGNEACSNTE
jgi:N6-adenosine-specific RNA methylase IME4